ncbi:MAG: hypothetical protein NT084_05165 [Bacteroidetes bacterium]|jgi:hypothetical protein|nr:hypothetical protein [Bacteroidota bacterium]
MKKIVFIFLSIIVGTNALHAGKIDEKFLKKITGTKWDLVAEKKCGKLFEGKNKNPKKESITFSEGTILFDLSDQNYACNYTLKNKVELWLYCTEPDQYIYKIQTLNNREMVLDMWVKDRKGNYIKTTRMYFHIHP